MADRSLCQFYTRIGACRHGEKCSRRHVKPQRSYTVLLSNFYPNPKLNKNQTELNPKQLKEHFENFYKDVFVHLSAVDKIVSMVVCDNENDHLNGNVYIKYKTMEGAQRAVIELNQQWFGGRPVHCELSPVNSFFDASCRAYDKNQCNRGDHCNFMHIIRPSDELKQQLMVSQDKSILLKEIAVIRERLNSKKVPVETPVEAQPKSIESLFNV